MRASVTVFGDHAFRIRRENQRGRAEWAPKINASVFQVIAVSFTDYDLGQITRRRDAIFEEYVDLVSTDERWTDYVRSATGDFNRIEYVSRSDNERRRQWSSRGPISDVQGCRFGEQGGHSQGPSYRPANSVNRDREPRLFVARSLGRRSHRSGPAETIRSSGASKKGAQNRCLLHLQWPTSIARSMS